MRSAILVIALMILIYDWCGQRVPGTAASALLHEGAPLKSSVAKDAARPASVNRVDFDSQIKPILQSKCMPCHFSGGVMYEKMPFDRPETIKHFGTKLFTRIKDEGHRQLIRDFLAQTP